MTNLLVDAKGDSTASKIPRYLRHACIAGERGGGIFSTKEHPAPEVHTLAHTLASGQVAEQLETNVERGLTTQEATERLRQYGHNKLETSGGVSWWRILIRQVSNSLTFVLAIAMILSFVTLDFIEGGVIAAVICLNIVVGFVQDFRAEQTIQSLLAMAAPVC
ncbi:hypothetical protein KC335_g18823, partial [Hortaea werneckii]